MPSHPPHSQAEEVRYRKLDAIDGKCGSLVAVTSALLVFISLPPIFDSVRLVHPLVFKSIFLALLASSLIALVVLSFKEGTSEKFVDLRKYALNTAVGLTAACCVVVAAIVATRL